MAAGCGDPGGGSADGGEGDLIWEREISGVGFSEIITGIEKINGI